jgi:hypothetical protein
MQNSFVINLPLNANDHGAGSTELKKQKVVPLDHSFLQQEYQQHDLVGFLVILIYD